MKRRDFIAALGGAAAWPIVARAQQAERVRRIGILLPAAANDPQYQTRIDAFLQGLQQLGWSIGRNLRVDTRWGTANAAEIRKYAEELVALAPDVILSSHAGPLAALLQATRAVPIVFAAVSDPAAQGRAARHASGGASGFHLRIRHKPVRRHSGCGSVAQCGDLSNQCA